MLKKTVLSYYTPDYKSLTGTQKISTSSHKVNVCTRRIMVKGNTYIYKYVCTYIYIYRPVRAPPVWDKESGGYEAGSRLRVSEDTWNSGH